MNRLEYNSEIKGLAEDLVGDAMGQNNNDIKVASDAIFNYMLHDMVDGHKWMSYYGHILDVLQNSDNRDAWESAFPAEDIGELITEHGGVVFDSTMAFYAMYEDVAQRVTDVIEQY